MNGQSRRMRTVGLRVLAIGLALTFAAAGPAHARSASTVHRGVPGAWDARISRDDGVEEEGVFEFARSGELTVKVGDGGEGEGTWSSTGRSTFEYEFVEQLYEGDTHIGYVEVEHDAVLGDDKSTFTSEGTGTLYDSEGQQVDVIKVTVTATKRS